MPTDGRPESFRYKIHLRNPLDKVQWITRASFYGSTKTKTGATTKTSCHHRRGIFEFIFVSTNSTGRKDTRLLLIDNGGVETLGLLDVDGLDVGVELLLGTLLVVTLAGDADTEAERNALDTGFPDLLVQLGVEADIGGTLLRWEKKNG